MRRRADAPCHRRAGARFGVDVVSVLPFEVVSVVFDSSSFSQLKILRSIRLLRLAKVKKVIKHIRLTLVSAYIYSATSHAKQTTGRRRRGWWVARARLSPRNPSPAH
jgi:hypothetical protein